MAVPKKRTGKAAQASRRANWKGTVPETTICTNCGATVLTHTVCTECGTYKGKTVSKKVVKTERRVMKMVSSPFFYARSHNKMGCFGVI